MAATFFTKPDVSPERQEFYERLAACNAGPLWESLARMIPAAPEPSCVPAIWRYADMRPLILESGKLITAQEAERRVLMLRNPGIPDGFAKITGSLYAGLQVVMPGEVTPTHRHVTAALRFIIEGQGAYTAVDGERATMRPGDLILTPSWTYHDHGNPSPDPIVWMDALDIPIINLFDTSFAERYPGGTQALIRPEGAPSFKYPYDRSRKALVGPVDPRHGIKMEYAGGPIPTISTFLQLLPAGFRGGSYRATDATVYCVAEGQGRTRIGETVFDWREHDIFVTPSWQRVSHEAQRESVLFSFSDRAAQKALGLWREEEP